MGLYEFLNTEDGSSLGISSIAASDSLTQATIILGARRSDLPTDQLLAGASFVKLIKAARATFDIVILDTPPIGPVIDGLYIAPFADVIIFCTKWASTSQIDAKKAISNLSAVKRPEAEIFCALNQQDESARAYRQKYGGYYDDAY